MLRFDDLKVKVDEASSGVAVLLELSAFYSPEEGEGGVP
jgi:hypothetical protein